MLPKIGFKGWICTLCYHVAHRVKWGGWFECSNPTCTCQHAEWVDVE